MVGNTSEGLLGMSVVLTQIKCYIESVIYKVIHIVVTLT